MLIARNATDTVITITDMNLTIAPGDSENLDSTHIYNAADSDELSLKISNGSIVINDGTEDLTPAAAINHIHGQLITPKDRSGKIRMHQTSRKLGLRVMWMGVGDDPTDIKKVGGGNSLALKHEVGDTEPLVKYLDFNICENETWLHEGYLTWKDAQLDTLTLEMCCRAPTFTMGSNTFYNLYGGYLIIPAAGDGIIDVTSDLTDPIAGGLIQMPNNDLNEPPTAFWNADYNSSTGLYENISPAPYGNGRYNIFAGEIIFARFINKIPLLGSGFIALNSSDTDQMGQGMRLKMTADTNTEEFPDHDWAVACIMCLHREASA